MDYFDNDDEDDWIFDVPLPGEKRGGEEEEEEDDWIFDVALPGEKRRRRDTEDEDDDDNVGEMSGGHLFEFDIEEGEMPRRWRNVVHKTRHKATLRQTRETRDGDHLGNAMSEAVRLALVSIVSKHPNLPFTLRCSPMPLHKEQIIAFNRANLK